jgi:hypothetical protein
MTKVRWFQNIIFILFFSILFFLIRFPLYRSTLFGEEGYFADIFLNPRHESNYGYLLANRINGINHYTIFQHPALAYEILGIFGKVFLFFWPLKQVDISTMLRFAFSLPQYIFWVSLIIVLIYLETRNNGFLFNIYFKVLIIILASSTLAILSSYELQIDNTIGVFITGSFSILMLYFLIEKPIIGIKQLSFILIMGVIQGMGKSEWSIAFISASLLTLVYEIYQRKRKNSDNHYIQIIIWGIVGCGLGVVINYFVDPQNYLAGIKLILNFIANDANTWDWTRWLIQFKENFLFLIFPLIDIYINLHFVIIEFKNHFSELNILYLYSFIYAMILFGSYFFHMYEYARYYSPLIPLLSILTIYVYFKRFKRNQDLYIKLSISLMALISIYASFLSVSHVLKNQTNFQNYLYESRQYQINKAENDGCIPIIDSAYGVFHPEIDFISNSFSRDEINFISKFAGKIPCDSTIINK